jgi:two-component system response regulator GlrR
MARKILLIDDDEQITDVLSILLERNGYELRVASDGPSALQIAGGSEVDVILLDLRLGTECGLNLVPELKELRPNSAILMITAHGDLDSAIEGFKLGISGYIKKPFREGELLLEIEKACQAAALRSSVSHFESKDVRDQLRSRIPSVDPVFDPIYQRIALAAQVTSPVVIHGESGTGKELVARALHECGARSQGPFVAFNCGAVPENLAEAELFGYAKGAFTDAKENKPGLFVRADRGTLFLDEIAEATPALQTKLLRVLQEKEVTPIGAKQSVRVNVRVLSASHQQLQKRVEAGLFRQDLFYRLHVLSISLPALRSRPRDIPFLANLLARRIAETHCLIFEGFTASALERMQSYEWPGNIRELQNKIEQAMILVRGGVLNAESIFQDTARVAETMVAFVADPSQAAHSSASIPSFFEAKVDFERSYLMRVLKGARGNIARAARIASKSRTEVYSLLKKHGLDPDSFK